MDIVEQAKIRLVIDGKEAVNELQVIDAKISALREKQKDYAKGTKEYAESKVELRELEKSYKLVEERMDISKMTLKQLGDYQRALIKEMKNVDPTSEGFTKMGDRLREVNTRSSEMTRLIRATNDEVTQSEGIWSKFGGWIKGAFAVYGIMELWQTIKGFATGSLEDAKNFESAAQSLKGEVKLTTEQFDALKKSAIENGEAFGMSGEQMLKAYNAIASGKSDLIDVKGGIEAVTAAAITLATNGEMELDVAAKVMTESLNQFGAGAKDAAKFVDILSTGTQVGAGKIEEIGMALKYAGPMAKAAGLGFGETNAALQILHQNGIKGEQAGTALRGMLAHLLKGANETNPSIVGMGTAMDNLAKKNLSAKEMVALFGQEAVSAGIAVVSNSKQLREWTAVIEKGGGAAEMFAEKTNTVEYAEKQAAAAFTNSRKEIGDKLLPIWLTLVNFFTDYGIPSIKAVATGFIAVIQGLMELPKFIAENKELFIGLGVALVSLNAANIAAAASALYMAAAEKGRAVVTKASAAAQWLLNAAMTANPIGLVIAAIAALTGGIVWAYKNVDWFRAGIQGLWAGLKELMKIVWDVQVAFLKLDFSAAWDRIKNGWSSVSKASGEAYVKSMAESNKKVAEDTKKTNNDLADHGVKKVNEATGKATKIKAAAGKVDTENAKEELDKQQNDYESFLKKKDKLFVESIQDEINKKIVKLQQDYENEIEAIDKLNIDKIEKDKFVNELKAQLVKDIEKVYSDANDKRKKENEKTNKAIEDSLRSLTETTIDLKKWETERTKDLNKVVEEISKKAWEDEKKRIEEEKQKKQQRFEDMVNMGLDAYDQLLQKATDYFTKVEETSTDHNKKLVASLNKDFLKPLTENVNAAKAILSGDMAGAAEGLIGYFKGLWDVTFGLRKTLKDNAKDLFNAELEADFANLSQYIESINATFGNLANDMAKVAQATDNSIGGRIAAEIKAGEQIKANYETAMAKENAYSDTVKKNIEDAYSLEVQRINDKYNLLAAKAAQKFDAESLAIQQGVNAELFGFISNEEQKNRLTGEYQSKRNAIIETFANQIKPITEGMSQAEIDGINAATKARDTALAQMESWYTEELKFVIENNMLKVDSYTEAEKVIQKGKDDTAALGLKYQAGEIANNTAKNLELFTAENNKNTALENEAKRHNDYIVQLGQDKDTALAQSFGRLKDAMLGGYAEMAAAAKAAYDQGLLTAAQYDAAIGKANYLRDSMNGVKAYDPSNFNDYNAGNLTGFAGGTEYLDPDAIYGYGTDKVPILGDRGERILDKNLNALLGGISNEELVRRAVGGVSASSSGLVNKISNSAIAISGTSAPVARLSSTQRPQLSQSVSNTHNVYNSANVSTQKMENLLADIHAAIVEKEVLSMGMLNSATSAVAVNISRSRFG